MKAEDYLRAKNEWKLLIICDKVNVEFEKI